METRKLLNDKKLWFASVLIAWAAALQGHMMWVKRQDSFKQKFGISAKPTPTMLISKLRQTNILLKARQNLYKDHKRMSMHSR